MRTPSIPPLAGFTRAEAICAAVVGVVAILLVLAMISGLPSASAHRTQAEGTARYLMVAITAYYLENDRFPTIPSDEQRRDQWAGDPAMGAKQRNSSILLTLRAIPQGPNLDHKQNEKRVVYFDYKAATMTSGWPRNGLCVRAEGSAVEAPSIGSLYDPWGREYGIIMDTSNDQRIDLQSIYSDFAGTNAPLNRVGVFSGGKDGSLGKKGNRAYKSGMKVSDDVISWQ